MIDVECIECKRPLRQHRKGADERPGTVRAGGRGLCSTCHTRHHRNGTLDRFIPRARGRVTVGTAECLDCKRPIRPASATLEQWPGTVKGNMGRCYTCHTLHLNGTTPEAVARAAATLSAYLEWRRPFRAKAGAL